MLNVGRLFKNYRETGSFNEQINLYGFVDGNLFLTKTGDLGAALEVQGVDFECLDTTTVDHLTKRLESALKLFDEKFRVYQYLFKVNNQTIPYKLYGNSVLDAAIQTRVAHLSGNSDNLYSLTIYYIVLFEGFRNQQRLISTLLELPARPGSVLRETWRGIRADKQILFLETEIQEAQNALHQKLESFLLQVRDFLPTRLLAKKEVFRILYRTLNFSPLKIETAKLLYDTFLDCQVCDSQLECHRGHLRLDDYYVRVLTLKEPSAQSFPLIFKRLLEVEANYFIVTEWKKEDSGKTRRVVQAKRRHFHNSKRSFSSQMSLNDGPLPDLLLDDSKESRVRELGEAIKEMELEGHYFGHFSLSIVLYDRELAKVDRACAEFYKVFSAHDARLFEERLNLLNAFLAAVPANYAFNLRYMYLLNTNYADYSFLFTLQSGEAWNRHLQQEYLAVLETNHRTAYFLNLHHRDLAHTIILGRTGAGKSFLLNFLVTHLQKYAPHTFILDLGGSFESLARLFGGSYVKVGFDSADFKINPFSLSPTKPNLDFLTLFLKVLMQASGAGDLDPATERDLYRQIENLYEVDPALRTLGVLANTLRRDLAERLSKWTRGGQFGFLFDNPEDTISFSRFQCFDFQKMGQYPDLLQPLLFYILHRADAVITDKAITTSFKAFLIDEAWVFLKNPSIQRYVLEALKTWRKHNAAMVLSTQSLDELRRSDILNVIIESCATKIFLANPDMDRDLYGNQFHLNEKEVDLISKLIPKRQFLIKTPELAKIANLTVDPKSYWIYTNDPYDNERRKEVFAQYGFEKGLEVLAGEPR
jgi:type IV secretion system protein VirB4